MSWWLYVLGIVTATAPSLFYGSSLTENAALLFWSSVLSFVLVTVIKSFIHPSFPGAEPSMITSPPRRWPIKLFDILFSLPVLRNLSLINLSPESLLAAAQERTGLNDFGDEIRLSSGYDFRTALTVLSDSIIREAQLTPFGCLMTRERLIKVLSTRLTNEQFLKEHPAVLEQDLWSVVGVVGLQRTGTTILHRLLASSPKFRVLTTWEAINPAPLSADHPLVSFSREADKRDIEARVAEARMNANVLAYLAPHFFAIHPIDPLSAEEDVMLLDHALLSQVPEAIMHVPSYSKWVEAQDMRHAYAYMRRELLILQWQSRLRAPTAAPRTWLLKTPAHLEHLVAFHDVFPSLRIVHTHREPRECMVSFASMVAHQSGIFSSQRSAEYMAAHWLQKNERMIKRSIAFRQEHKDVQALDVRYTDILSSPESTVRRIYEWLEIAFDAEAQRRLQEVITRSPQHKYGKHRYTQRAFGNALTDEKLQRAFQLYYQTYKDVLRDVRAMDAKVAH